MDFIFDRYFNWIVGGILGVFLTLMSIVVYAAISQHVNSASACKKKDMIYLSRIEACVSSDGRLFVVPR